ncbi:hypothetical protein CON25_25560 [Bacillus thuringiensis]|uniref:hypothetical protein n=1 Tax=Bacillus thuringiensis TaxID=1428 RepID=UPI000BEB78A4|nr:hypothetical protein [Bacillus thuringiensis]PEC70897.1 hypothetical protein CON25_25560 [Bacillus thuringiensis]
MAYENGYEIKEYFQSNMDRYAEDSLIFTKALSIINTYLNRVDWPFCIEEMENTLSPILGSSIVTLGFWGHYFSDTRIEWPEGDFAKYKIDATAFYKTINPIMEQFYSGRNQPFKLSSIVATDETEGNYIRFIRNDGQKFDIEATENDLNNIVSILERIMERKKIAR